MDRKGFAPIIAVIIIAAIFVAGGAYLYLHRSTTQETVSPSSSTNGDAIEAQKTIEAFADQAAQEDVPPGQSPAPSGPLFSASSDFSAPYVVSWYEGEAQSEIDLVGISIAADDTSAHTITFHLAISSHVNLNTEYDYQPGLFLVNTNGDLLQPISPIIRSEPTPTYYRDVVFETPNGLGKAFSIVIAPPHMGNISSSFTIAENADGVISVQASPSGGQGRFLQNPTNDSQFFYMTIIAPHKGTIVSGTVPVIVGVSSNKLTVDGVTVGGATEVKHATTTPITGIGQVDYYYFLWNVSGLVDGLNEIHAVASISASHGISIAADGEAEQMVRVTDGLPQPSLPAGQIYWEDALSLISQCQAISLLEVNKDYLGNTDYINLSDGTSLTLIELVGGKPANPGLDKMSEAANSVESTCGVIPVTSQRIPQPIP